MNPLAVLTYPLEGRPLAGSEHSCFLVASRLSTLSHPCPPKPDPDHRNNFAPLRQSASISLRARRCGTSAARIYGSTVKPIKVVGCGGSPFLAQNSALRPLLC